MATNSGDFTSNLQESKKNSVGVKVGMLGDQAIGKTSLMVKYVEGTFDEDYIETLGKFTCFFLVNNTFFCCKALVSLITFVSQIRRQLHGENCFRAGY